MTEVYGRPHGPRVVRTTEGFALAVDGRVVPMTKTDLLWLSESVHDAMRSVAIDALYGGGRATRQKSEE